jgi:hypothetical protein
MLFENPVVGDHPAVFEHLPLSRSNNRLRDRSWFQLFLPLGNCKVRLHERQEIYLIREVEKGAVEGLILPIHRGGGWPLGVRKTPRGGGRTEFGQVVTKFCEDLQRVLVGSMVGEQGVGLEKTWAVNPPPRWDHRSRGDRGISARERYSRPVSRGLRYHREEPVGLGKQRMQGEE